MRISIKSIVIGITVSLILFLIVRKNPYALAVGPVIAIILAKPITWKMGAIYGLLTGATLTLFLVAINAIPDASDLFHKSLEAIFIIFFWSCYGAVLVSLKQSWVEGRPKFF